MHWYELTSHIGGWDWDLCLIVLWQIARKRNLKKKTTASSRISSLGKKNLPLSSFVPVMDGADTVLVLVKEVAKSKDETIRAKDQMIQMLEAMVARKPCACVNSA